MPPKINVSLLKAIQKWLCNNKIQYTSWQATYRKSALGFDSFFYILKFHKLSNILMARSSKRRTAFLNYKDSDNFSYIYCQSKQMIQILCGIGVSL